MLFSGPPGIGKTTLAHLVASELGVMLRTVGAPAIEHKGTLAVYLTSLEPRGVLFIDEVHRLQPVVEEYLYPAMEDFRLEIPVGDGPNAEMLPLSLPRFSLVAATTPHRALVGAVLVALRHRLAARLLQRRPS